MVPPSHSRISRYHGLLTRRPVAGPRRRRRHRRRWRPGSPSRLKLKTSFTELLPSNDPGVVALARTQKRLGDLSLLLIGIRSPDHEANLRYAEALTQKLRALPPTVVNLATYHVRDVRAFFQQNKWLYVSEDDLESIRDRLRTEISKRKNPLLRVAGRRRTDRFDAAADVGQAAASTIVSRAACSPARARAATTSGSRRCRRAGCSSRTRARRCSTRPTT